MEESIEKLKILMNAYLVSKDWNYNEKYTYSEYSEKIGIYLDWTPIEIADEICLTIHNI